MAVGFEVRVDYDRLRRERLAKAKKALEESGLGALVCFDPNNTRYITSSTAGTRPTDVNRKERHVR
jgi:Xaa-Pro dipeptidase